MLNRCVGMMVLVCAGLLVFATAGFTASKKSREAVAGEALYVRFCAHCHGLKGGGDGFNAEFLDKEPAELGSQKFLSKKDNEQLFRVISQGGAGVNKSTLMPPFGNTLSDGEIWSLVAFLRVLAKDTEHPVSAPKNAEAKNARPEAPLPNADQISAFSARFARDGKSKEMVEQGRELFYKKKSCAGCHRVDDKGGMVGPDLSRSGFAYTPEWLFTWMHNPQKLSPGTKMPNIPLTEDEDLALAAFLTSRKSGEAPAGDWAQYIDPPGDPKKGEALFFDVDGNASCAKCHSVGDKGGKVGPPLSHVGDSRTPGFLLESILDPSAVITAGYTSVMILTQEGKLVTGVKKIEDDAEIEVVDKEGRALTLHKNRIKKIKTQKISIMPGNFKEVLGTDEIRNVLAYLRTLKIR